LPRVTTSPDRGTGIDIPNPLADCRRHSVQ
jgi:hypothetical protein